MFKHLGCESFLGKQMHKIDLRVKFLLQEGHVKKMAQMFLQPLKSGTKRVH